MIATQAVGAAVALGGAIYGQIASNKKNKEAQAMLQQQKKANKSWYDAKMSEDFTRRTDSQVILDRQRQMLADQLKQSRATNAVAGGTNEAVAVQQQAAANSVANTSSNLAAQAANYKNNVENQYRSQDLAFTQQQIETKQNEAQQAAQAGEQAMNAGMNLVEEK